MTTPALSPCCRPAPTKRRQPSVRPRAVAVEHWQDAIEQGAIAGANAAGGDAKRTVVPAFSTIKFIQHLNITHGATAISTADCSSTTIASLFGMRPTVKLSACRL